jgi:hypothetical protein
MRQTFWFAIINFKRVTVRDIGNRREARKEEEIYCRRKSRILQADIPRGEAKPGMPSTFG